VIYLASPYSHRFKHVRRFRYDAVCLAAARLIARGEMVFAPVAHSHGIVEKLSKANIRHEWAFWADFDTKMLSICSELYVLRLHEWEKSVGVTAEIKLATAAGKPITYIDP
jgi:hypothetical protein